MILMNSDYDFLDEVIANEQKLREMSSVTDSNTSEFIFHAFIFFERR